MCLKCNLPEVIYLGYWIDKNGLHPTEDKTKATLQAPTPKNTTELRVFLGLIIYYGKFLPNLSMVLAPCTSYLRITQECRAFQDTKNLLKSPRVLIHYGSS